VLGGVSVSSSTLLPKDAIASLLATACLALDSNRHATKSCIQHVAALLGIELSSSGGGAAERTALQGCLAPWQAKRLRTYIDLRLATSLRVTELAGIARLSTAYFHRAFRKTFGESPAAYITKRRIRRAQDLMLTSELPLSQIALACGMFDQAHFCRVFRRIVGTNPSGWRRSFRMEPAPEDVTV
jgi:AraC family transcriptional regulator